MAAATGAGISGGVGCEGHDLTQLLLRQCQVVIEAVAAGMVLAAELSRDLGWIDDEAVERCRALIVAAHLPVKAPGEMDSEQFMALMAVDKKVLDGRLRLILMQALGQSVIAEQVDLEALRACLDKHLAKA